MCSFFLQGRCTKGPACTFAHSESELHPGIQNAPEDTVEPSFDDAAGADVEDDLALDDDFERLIGESAGPGVPSRAPTVFGDDLMDEEVAAADNQEEGLPSAALGPRHWRETPQSLCRFWLRHPIFCKKGDACPNAHGLEELGVDSRSAVIRCSGSGPTATVFAEAPDSAVRGSGGPAHAMGAEWTGWGPPKGCDAGSDRYGPPSSDRYGPPSSDRYGPPADKGKGKGKGGGMQALPAPPTSNTPVMPTSRFGSGFHPTKICQFWYQDPSACTKGESCTFAHGVQELEPSKVESCGVSRFHHNPVKPTKMCTFFQSNACTRGLQCTFAHDSSELAQGQR